ncbi:MAG: hypothetical protein K5905_21210, partial [Roseibium sp.]|uniref:LysR substrate-binding domain-containing protein n=1 Tax=Roseibium sp. TaxID=1936156 RepID=UPI0026054B9B
TGARLLPHCESLRQVQEDLQETLDRSGADLQQTLKITAPHVICQSLLVPVLSRFLTTGGGKIRLIAEDAPINLVEHKIDLAIRLGGTAPQTAHISRIGYLHKSLFASNSFLAERGGIPALTEELATWPHIANDWQGDPVVYETGDGTVLRVSPLVRCNTVLGVRDFIAEGQGIGLLPDVLAVNEDSICSVIPIYKTPIYALHQHGRTPPKQVREIISWLRTALRDRRIETGSPVRLVNDVHYA